MTSGHPGIYTSLADVTAVSRLTRGKPTLNVRQSYAGLAPRLAAQVGHYSQRKAVPAEAQGGWS